jgi:hypothetical protein
MSESASALNAAADAARTDRAAEAAATPTVTPTPKRAPAKRGPKTPKTPTPKTPTVPVKVATARKALSPKERAAKPVTATIAAYVVWLEKTLGRKLSGPEKSIAGISITLYGNYQNSPERKLARDGK